MKKEFVHSLWVKVASATAKKLELKCPISIVSFSFDDAPLTAFTNGGKILENYGYRATYYISAGLIDRQTAVGKIADFDVIQDFCSRGHEIGNHTYNHLDCRKKGFWGIVRSIRRNRRTLTPWMSDSFAYPYGAIDARARVAAGVCTTSARGVSFGINRTSIDLMHLKAARVYHRESLDISLGLVNECFAQGGWLIFYTHDVSERPSDFGCTPENLNRLVRAVNDRKLTVMTVKSAMQYMKCTAKKTKYSL
jgi:peptidoglycan/xylan/chitin deacetylase (PgdA/CDA1 family)